MATAEVRRELAKAEERLAKAETALEAFNEGEDEGLLLKKLRRRRKELDEEDKKEKARLEEKEKSLEADKRECRQQVEKLQDRLTAATTAQPGNDFVTRR